MIQQRMLPKVAKVVAVAGVALCAAKAVSYYWRARQRRLATAEAKARAKRDYGLVLDELKTYHRREELRRCETLFKMDFSTILDEDTQLLEEGFESRGVDLKEALVVADRLQRESVAQVQMGAFDLWREDTGLMEEAVRVDASVSPRVAGKKGKKPQKNGSRKKLQKKKPPARGSALTTIPEEDSEILAMDIVGGIVDLSEALAIARALEKRRE